MTLLQLWRRRVLGNRRNVFVFLVRWTPLRRCTFQFDFGFCSPCRTGTETPTAPRQPRFSKPALNGRPTRVLPTRTCLRCRARIAPVAPLPTHSTGKAFPLLLHRRAAAPVIARAQLVHQRSVRPVQAAVSRRCVSSFSRTLRPVTCPQVSSQRSAATWPPRARSCCAAGSCALQGLRNGACRRACLRCCALNETDCGLRASEVVALGWSAMPATSFALQQQ